MRCWWNSLLVGVRATLKRPLSMCCGGGLRRPKKSERNTAHSTQKSQHFPFHLCEGRVFFRLFWANFLWVGIGQEEEVSSTSAGMFFPSSIQPPASQYTRNFSLVALDPEFFMTRRPLTFFFRSACVPTADDLITRK